MTLLLINGSPVLMDITRRILERAGYEVRCADTLSGARELLADSLPDGIVLENELTDGKGLEYCRELRKICDVPIMFISGDREDELPALHAGASDFLRKPFDFNVLKARLGIILNEAGGAPGCAEAAPLAESSQGGEDAPDPGAGAVKRRNILTYTSLFLTVAACLAVVLTGVFVLARIGVNPGVIDITDDTVVPLAEGPPIFLSEPSSGVAATTGHGISLPRISELTLPARADSAELPFWNPADNECRLKFEVRLGNTGETILSTGYIEPGEHAGTVSLLKELTPGQYWANLYIRAYAEDSPDELVGTDLSIIVNVI